MELHKLRIVEEEGLRSQLEEHHTEMVVPRRAVGMAVHIAVVEGHHIRVGEGQENHIVDHIAVVVAHSLEELAIRTALGEAPRMAAAEDRRTAEEVAHRMVAVEERRRVGEEVHHKAAADRKGVAENLQENVSSCVTRQQMATHVLVGAGRNSLD